MQFNKTKLKYCFMVSGQLDIFMAEATKMTLACDIQSF